MSNDITTNPADRDKTILTSLIGKLKVEGMPIGANQVLAGLTNSEAEIPGLVQFNSRSTGTWTAACVFGSKRPVWPVEYQRAIINILDAHYRRDADDPDKVYCRDRNLHGAEPLSTWHEAPSFGQEEGLSVRKRLPNVEAFLNVLLDHMTQYDPARFPKVRRGIRLHDRDGLEVRCYVLDGRPFMTNEEHNDTPFLVDVEVPVGVLPHNEDEMCAIYEEVMGRVRFVTRDEASANNMILYWAYPFMSSRPRWLWVMYGFGLNGKNLYIDRFRTRFDRWCADIDPNDLAAGGYDGKDAAAALRDKFWAFDSEADLSAPRVRRPLKKLATGDAIRTRTIGEVSRNLRTFLGYCAGTNETVARALTKAYKRRLVFVRMRDGHTDKDFVPTIEWFDHDNGDVKLVLASAYAWLLDIRPDLDVAIGDIQDLDLASQWFVSEVTDNGFARTPDNPYLASHQRAGKTMLEMLGLRSTQRRGEWVIAVGDEAVFAPYRDSYLKLVEQDREQQQRDEERLARERAAMPCTDVDALVPLAISRVDWAKAKRRGGETGMYVPAGGGSDGKIAMDWKKRIEAYSNGDQTAAQLTPPPDATPWAQVTGPGQITIDWDADHLGTGYEHGLTLMERDLGTTLGSPILPMPFLERSARGGLHGTYAIPDGLLASHFKKSVNGSSIRPNQLVDTKANGGGYVITAGSRTRLGVYEPVVMPKDGKIPTLTQPMLDWLINHGYLDLPVKPITYIGPDGFPHSTPSQFRINRTKSDARVDGPSHGIKPNDKPMTPGARHNEARDRIWGQAERCRERGLPQSDFDRCADAVRRAAGDHDPDDTERSIRSAAEKNGYTYHK